MVRVHQTAENKEELVRIKRSVDKVCERFLEETLEKSFGKDLLWGGIRAGMRVVLSKGGVGAGGTRGNDVLSSHDLLAKGWLFWRMGMLLSSFFARLCRVLFAKSSGWCFVAFLPCLFVTKLRSSVYQFIYG
ncbi:hypothetical protein [Bartonella senegalensis]|uniref:hypothetical protein n=1 Tax=Bartonella senegalensis TaxID=1468418 RepID=UPI00055E10F7|nr:hypothetical protein [Bartonella senegalensis]